MKDWLAETADSHWFRDNRVDAVLELYEVFGVSISVLARELVIAPVEHEVFKHGKRWAKVWSWYEITKVPL